MIIPVGEFRTTAKLNAMHEDGKRHLAPEIISLIRECSRDEASFGRIVKALSAYFSELTSQLTIMVVDDDPEVSQLIAAILEKERYQVICADSGEVFLDLVKKFSPSLFLVDVAMPGMQGGDVYHHIRHTSHTCNTPVIFVTGMVNNEEEVQLNRELSPLDRYLAKPFSAEHLLETVKQLVGDAHSTQRLPKVD